jgi:hypothetical protein
MSGLDEQDGMKECIQCKEIPDYWRGSLGEGPRNSVVWMYSKHYIKNGLGLPYNQYAGEYERKMVDGEPNIDAIYCTNCRYAYTEEEHPIIVNRVRKAFTKAYYAKNLYVRS